MNIIPIQKHLHGDIFLGKGFDDAGGYEQQKKELGTCKMFTLSLVCKISSQHTYLWRTENTEASAVHFGGS